jgi:hypothetical protein
MNPRFRKPIAEKHVRVHHAKSESVGLAPFQDLLFDDALIGDALASCAFAASAVGQAAFFGTRNTEAKEA